MSQGILIIGAFILFQCIGNSYAKTVNSASCPGISPIKTEKHNVQSRKQMEQSWRFNFHGQERLFISDANIIINDENLEWSSLSNIKNLNCFPALENPDSEKSKQAGIFSHTAISVPKVNVTPDMEKLSDREWKINIQSLPERVKDIFLFVDYIGSTGDLLVDGKKYSNDRYNSKGWDICIKRFLNNSSYELTIRENVWDNSVMVIAPEHRPKTNEELRALIHFITFVPEYLLLII